MRLSRRRVGLVLLVLPLALVTLIWWQLDWLQAQLYFLVLDSEERVESLRVAEVVEALEVEAGTSVADIGAGTGLFTWPLSVAAGEEGTVYAVDINPTLLAHLEEQTRERNLENVQVVRGGFDDPLLPEPVDLIFICDTLHHIDAPDRYLRTLRQHLRPGGRVAVIDFRSGESPHFMASRKYSELDLFAWMQAAGYGPARRHDLLEENFFLVFECIDCPEA